MFIEANGIIRFEARNEDERKLLKHIKRKNGWAVQRRFNSFKDNNDGTITLFLNDGHMTKISSSRLPEILESGKISVNKSNVKRYAQIKHDGGTINLHRFLVREELEKYDGFTEETGYRIEVNHIDENPFNNTDDNLEVVTINENQLKYRLNNAKGFTKNKCGKFSVFVCEKYRGQFGTEKEAREVYVQAVKAELKRLEELRINWLISKGRI
jgi:hypothetical protein